MYSPPLGFTMGLLMISSMSNKRVRMSKFYLTLLLSLSSVLLVETIPTSFFLLMCSKQAIDRTV